LTAEQEQKRIQDEARAAEIEAEKEKTKQIKTIRQGLFSTTVGLINALSQIRSNYYAQLLMDEELSEDERKRIQRDAAIDAKKFALFEGIITGAQAIISGFATKPFVPLGLAMGTLATVLTGAQIAAIASQPIPELAEGGVVPALLHPNEAVLPLDNEEAMSRIADAITNARAPSVTMGDNLMHVTVNLGNKVLYDDITRATKDRRILIDGGAVV